MAVDTAPVPLRPFEVPEGEPSDLEAWVNDSHAAMEQLHSELTDWHAELARRETELDLREDVLGKTEFSEVELKEQIVQLRTDLAAAQEATKQLEEENSEQLQTLEELERQHAVLQAELRVERKRAQELVVLLDAERAQAADDHLRWSGELKQLRLLLEEHCEMLSDQFASAHELEPEDESDFPADLSELSAVARSAELRRRAKARRAAAKRRQQDEN